MALVAPAITSDSGAGVVARFLRARGIDRVFGLCGGHIMPIWMRLDAEGIRIIDMRDERAAVYMAHAHAELTGGLGVALITAGPGVTNAMTGIANAHVARAPVLVLSGVPPRPQENRGALQDMTHTDFVQPLTRYARTVREPALILQELDEAVARAFGQGGEPGPVYLDFPVDTLRAEVPGAVQLARAFCGEAAPARLPRPGASRARSTCCGRRAACWSSAAAVRAAPGRRSCACSTGSVRCISTPARAAASSPKIIRRVVAAMRGSVMGEADVVVTLGRRLDFQLAYGSPAVYGDAKFLRIADAPSELRDNRRGAVEILATPALALEAMLQTAGNRAPAADRDWAQRVREKHRRAHRQAARRDARRRARTATAACTRTGCSPRCATRCRRTRSSLPTAATS